MRERGAQLAHQDVADAIGTTVGYLRVMVVRGNFPEPDGHVGRTPWWLWATVEDWLRRRGETAC